VTTTRDLQFIANRETITVPAGTPCEEMRESELDPIGQRLRRRISDVPRSGLVLVRLAGLGRWVPQDALSTWRPLTYTHNGYTTTTETLRAHRGRR